ncbi:type II toxin-antitoxin system RelE/ParE family toxin [Nitratifractor sp.]
MKRYRIVIEPEAAKDLKNIYRFIAANDTTAKATQFLHKLQNSIASLQTMPRRFRRSIYLEEPGVHDLTIHGYTICYLVRGESVHILTVFRQRSL